LKKKAAGNGRCSGCGKRARSEERGDFKICLDCGYQYRIKVGSEWSDDGKRVVHLPPSGVTRQVLEGEKKRATPALRDGGARRVRQWSGRTSKQK
jgi:hypothetical protein